MDDKRKPRVVFFNRSYWPDVEATGQLLTELTKDLVADFDVEVVVGQPNHLNSDYDFQASGVQTHDGVKIRRLRHTRFEKHSFAGRLLNLLSFTWAAAWTSLWLPRADIVVTETDPFFLAFVGRWMQLRQRCRFVVYLQDIYPDIAIAVGKLKEGMISRWVRFLLFRAYRQADCVIVLSRDMLRTCVNHGVSVEKVRVIANWADMGTLKPQKTDNEFRRQHQLNDKFVVMYSGNLGLAHPLTPIIDSAELLKSDDRIVFTFVGDGAQRRDLEQDCRKRGLSNVLFLPYQPRDQLAQSLSAADAHLVTMLPAATGYLMPSKLYGILASATAVIVLASSDSELYEFVEKSEIGFACDLNRPNDVAERLSIAIRHLADQPDKTRDFGDNARRLAETEFDRPIQTGKIGRLFRELMSER